MKKDRRGILMIKGWDDAFDEGLFESQIKDHLAWVKKNTMRKRLHWKFVPFEE